MLILTRKPGESVYLGDDVKITIVEIKGHQIRLGIDAPRDLRIYREEIYEQIREENRQAAETGATSQGLEELSSTWKSKTGGERKTGKLSASFPKSKGDRDDQGSSKSSLDKSDIVVRRKKRSE